MQIGIDKLAAYNNELQRGLKSSLGDLNVKEQENNYLKLKIGLLEKDKALLSKENEKLKVKN